MPTIGIRQSRRPRWIGKQSGIDRGLLQNFDNPIRRPPFARRQGCVRSAAFGHKHVARQLAEFSRGANVVGKLNNSMLRRHFKNSFCPYGAG